MLTAKGSEMIAQGLKGALQGANAYALIVQGETVCRDLLEWDPEHLTIKGVFAYTGMLTAVVLEREGEPMGMHEFNPPIPVVMGESRFDGTLELAGA